MSSDGAKGRIYSYDNYEEDGVDYSVALVNTVSLIILFKIPFPGFWNII